MTEAKPNILSRRQILRQILGTSLGLPFAQVLPALCAEPKPSAPVGSAAGASVLSAEDDQFLNDLENANFLFFWEQGSAKTGMVKDRCNVHTDNQVVAASIAATGFGLTALCIGDRRVFSPLCAFCGGSCPIIAGFSTTSPMPKPGNACLTPRCLR
jgi:hypothetical protein